MVAAPMTGQGKTTVATGLMAALRGSGLAVSGHKVGPDYIDPGYHALATGRAGRNLDPHLVGEKRVAPLLLHGARGADVAVVEGVMGLHDGRLGTDGFASSAHVAALTRTPVVLVVDVARMSRSAGALVAGMAAFDPAVEVAGVILNRAGSERNTAEIVRSLEPSGLPVLGVVGRDEGMASPSRHLGLVPAGERDGAAAVVERMAEQIAHQVDLGAVMDVAGAAPALEEHPWSPEEAVAGAGSGAGSDGRPVVAVAGGRAFTFRYAETEELLTAAGCRVEAFDPLEDTALPAGTRGLYLGGGFPEVHAGELAANRALLGELREAVRSGVPTVAECAGMLYLARTLDGEPMAGAVDADARMSRRLTLRYPEAVAAADTLLTRVGDRVTGHEFHRTQLTPGAGGTDASALSPAWEIDGAAEGFASPTLHASYLHVHWAGHPRSAERFAAAVHAAAPLSPVRAASAASSARARGAAGATPDEAPVADPLRHHGDREVGSGLIDLAVNVYAGPRPAWLDRALRASLDDVGSYPDAGPARTAIARRHDRRTGEVLPTAGAAEAFTLLARVRPWRRPVVVHPQFTEPHAALEQAGHTVTTVLCRSEDGFAFDPDAVPEDADLVVVGNPTNPTGLLHPADTLRRLCHPGRVVAVDEAFMDAVPGEPESLAGERLPGLVVLRSLTKHWSIPGLRAGYVVGDEAVVAELARAQTPWSLSTPAIASTVACMSPQATVEAAERALTLQEQRAELQSGLCGAGVAFVPSRAPFVLVRAGHGAHRHLREQGIAVRRADTFPGLDASWVRVAVRPREVTQRLLKALVDLPGAEETRCEVHT
ncbi:cobyrinate a,c-diamide synthase [Nocardiopsis xinjiangensis]|uniref:cobyrinate a,c-diamide synthase n=1 Tax=Nocardiopsis xinjiangensis TaxID=124285 RepID=UPI0006888070